MHSQTHLIIDARDRDSVLAVLVHEIASQAWFGSLPSERLWLRHYLNDLYDRGLVYGDQLASVGLAAAKHRKRAAPAGNSRRRIGVFTSEDISVMRSLFSLANKGARHPVDSKEARALARRVMFVFRNGCEDPLKALDIIAAAQRRRPPTSSYR